MAGMLYDDKAAAQLEQAYATTDMIVQREEVRRSLRASAGESILDLGSGPGFLACELAQKVGATGRIVAVDISSDMNSIASKRVEAAGVGDRVDIFEGDATALAFADATFDAAASERQLRPEGGVEIDLRPEHFERPIAPPQLNVLDRRPPDARAPEGATAGPALPDAL